MYTISKFVILNMEVRLTCGEWNLYLNVMKFQNIMILAVALFVTKDIPILYQFLNTYTGLLIVVNMKKAWYLLNNRKNKIGYSHSSKSNDLNWQMRDNTAEEFYHLWTI